MKRNCLWFVICLALFAWAASDVKAQTRWNSGPTITVENMTFPAYPREYTQLKAQIEEIENKLRLAGSSVVEENDQDQRPTWNSLPERTQNYLIEKLTENPNLRVYDVRDLCPTEVSYKDFANIISAYKEKPDLENKLDELKQEQAYQTENYLTAILDKICSKHRDYNTINAKFPFDDLLPSLSDLHEQLKTYYNVFEEELGSDKILFDLCSLLWEESRPCILNSEPAQIALKFWTAFMRGNYYQAARYADENLGKILMEARSNPETREKFPTNSYYVGHVEAVAPFDINEEVDGNNQVGLLENNKLIISIAPGQIKYIYAGSQTLRVGPSSGAGPEEISQVVTTKDENGTWKVSMETIPMSGGK